MFKNVIVEVQKSIDWINNIMNIVEMTLNDRSHKGIRPYK